jgi:hypothetical protein
MLNSCVRVSEVVYGTGSVDRRMPVTVPDYCSEENMGFQGCLVFADKLGLSQSGRSSADGYFEVSFCFGRLGRKADWRNSSPLGRRSA